MSELVTITEACSCGSTFTWTGTWASYGERAAKTWRETHQHVSTPWVADPGANGYTRRLRRAQRPMRRPH